MRFLSAARWTFAAATLSAACSRSEAAPRAAIAQANQANGTLAPAIANVAARDTITDAADKGRTMGSAKAPIWIVMASDFQCPFCKQWHDESFQQLVQTYVTPGRVRLAYLNFPIRQHQNAIPAAEAAMCASAQDKFWQMHDALFASQQKWEDLPNPAPVLDSLAKSAGVDMRRWSYCTSKHQTLPLVQGDKDRLTSSGVHLTPTFFIGNDSIIAGVEPFADFKKAIDAALAKAAGGRAPARGKTPGS